MKKLWTLILLALIIAAFNACSKDSTDPVADDMDGVMSAGSEMSTDMDVMMSKDEFKAASDLDSYPLPFETPAYLKLGNYSLSGLASDSKTTGSFDFTTNCGTWEWNYATKLFVRTNTLPADTIKMLFPAKDSTVNNRRLLWWNCQPNLLDRNNLPTALDMRIEWVNNPNKRLNFTWTASYETIAFNDSTRVFPKTVNGEITYGNNNHGDYYVKLTGASDFTGITPLVNFQWQIYKGSSPRLHANLDITFTKQDGQFKFRPVYNLTLNNKHDMMKKMNMHTEINVTFDASKAWIANATVANVDSALSGYIKHKDKQVANLIVSGIAANEPATSFKFKDNAVYKFNNGKERSAFAIINKVITHKHPFKRYLRYFFHQNIELTPGYD